MNKKEPDASEVNPLRSARPFNLLPELIPYEKIAIIGISLFCLLAALTVAVSVRNRGFTKWMTYEEMDAFWKPLEAKGDDGKNYWDRGNWLTAVEGRWHDGRP